MLQVDRIGANQARENQPSIKHSNATEQMLSQCGGRSATVDRDLSLDWKGFITFFMKWNNGGSKGKNFVLHSLKAFSFLFFIDGKSKRIFQNLVEQTEGALYF